MYNISLCSILFLQIICYTKAASIATDGSTKPLFLTPYIESNNVDEGRKLAQVTGLGWNVTSYSGLLTVNKEYGSNMFFWYFPSERESANVPLCLWLNGFSTASTYGIFLQNGPFSLLESTDFTPRNTSWQKYYNVLYIDNPVGVGFSFTGSEEGYSTDFESVSANLHSALEQFFKLFPDLELHELYVTGLSLGGKYVSSLSYRIFKQKSFNMKGIFLGNPLLNPAIQVNYGEYLYELGFIDRKEERGVIDKENDFIDALKSKNYEDAYAKAQEFLLADNSYLLNVTGLDSVFNYYNPYIDTSSYDSIIRSKKLRDAVHVGCTQFGDGVKPMSMAAKIFDLPVTNFLQEMVETIKMLFYAGQVDISCGYPMLVNTLESLNWTGKAEYANADRHKLYSNNGTLWGYIKGYKTLTDVMVRKAGHSAITDQPDNILNLLMNFTEYDRFM